MPFSTGSAKCCATMADKPGQLGEFERIARFFRPLAAHEPGALALTDDAGLLSVPPGDELVLTVDAVVENVHFLPDDPPAAIARKALRVNLSDLAAMGAVPRSYLLTLCLPSARDDAWLAAFCEGLAADQKQFAVTLLGGDTVRTDGPATLSVTALGLVPQGRALKRGGALAGDTVFVTGTIGDAGLGLRCLRGELPEIAAPDADFLIDRYRIPQPRTGLGDALRAHAHAGLDISDGLLADIGHIARASNRDIALRRDAVPLSPAARAAVAAGSASVAELCTLGDDYELAFTASPSAADDLAAAAARAGTTITPIGEVGEKCGTVTLLDGNGVAIAVDGAQGYQH